MDVGRNKVCLWSGIDDMCDKVVYTMDSGLGGTMGLWLLGGGLGAAGTGKRMEPLSFLQPDGHPRMEMDA